MVWLIQTCVIYKSNRITLAFSGLKPPFRLKEFGAKFQIQCAQAALSDAVSTTDAWRYANVMLMLCAETTERINIKRNKL